MFVKDIHMDCRDPALAIHCYIPVFLALLLKDMLFNSQRADAG